MSNSLSRLAARLVAVERQVRGLSSPQLAYSAVEGGAIELRSGDGSLRGAVGTTFDGSSGTFSFNGPPPPQPTLPVLATAIRGFRVTWDGAFTDGSVSPMGFSRVEVHVSTTSGFTPTPATVRATIESPAGAEVAIFAPSPVAHYVVFVARSLAGVGSTPSGQSTITPSLVAGPDITADAIDGRIITGSTLRTSPTVGDGTASSQGVIIDASGLRGFASSSATPNTTISATDGKLTASNVNVSGRVVAASGEVVALTITGQLLMDPAILDATEGKSSRIVTAPDGASAATTSSRIQVDVIGLRTWLEETTNLVSNPSFEGTDPLASWTVAGNAISVISNNFEGQVEDHDPIDFGLRNLELAPLAGGAASVVQKFGGATVDPHTFSLYWAPVPGVTRSSWVAYARIEWLDANNAILATIEQEIVSYTGATLTAMSTGSTSTQNNIATRGYNRHVITSTPPAGTTQGQVTLRASNGSTSSPRGIVIDGIQVEKKPYVTAWRGATGTFAGSFPVYMPTRNIEGAQIRSLGAKSIRTARLRVATGDFIATETGVKINLGQDIREFQGSTVPLIIGPAQGPQTMLDGNELQHRVWDTTNGRFKPAGMSFNLLTDTLTPTPTHGETGNEGPHSFIVFAGAGFTSPRNRILNAADGTNITGIANTTPATGTPVVGMSFNAPHSGRIFVAANVNATSGSGGALSIVVDVRTGSALNSGTLITTVNNQQMINFLANGGGSTLGGHLVTGLTPGAVYHVVMKHFVSAGSTGGIFYRSVNVIPSP